jgi:hypothetical protein
MISVFLMQHHTMMSHVTVDAYIHVLLVSAVSQLIPRPVYPCRKGPGFAWRTTLSDSQTRSGSFAEEKTLPLPEIEPRFPGHSFCVLFFTLMCYSGYCIWSCLFCHIHHSTDNESNNCTSGCRFKLTSFVNHSAVSILYFRPCHAVCSL